MNDLTKLIFEKLGVGIGETFKIKGEVNHEYFIDGILKVWRVEENGNAQVSSYGISDFISGEYEIVKYLITKEEKEWLKGWNVSKVKKEEDIKYGAYIVIYNGNIGSSIPCSETKFNFSGLEIGKEYTPEELGLWNIKKR